MAAAQQFYDRAGARQSHAGAPGSSAGGADRADPVFSASSVKRTRERAEGHSGVERLAHPATRRGPKGIPALDADWKFASGVVRRIELARPMEARKWDIFSDCQKTPLSRGICDEPPHIRRGLGHATHRTGATERRLASNRPAFPTSGHRRPFPSRCAERGGRSPQAMAALRQRGVFDVVRPHACAVAQADRCGAGSRPVSTMQRCVQTHRRRGSAPDRDHDAQGC